METVRHCIASYPCGYANRTQALHQVLVVGGSGYEWRGGTVVSRFADGTTCARVHERFRYSAEKIADLRDCGIDVAEKFITGRCPDEELRDQASALARKVGPLGQEPYQPGPDLLFLNAPENADSDWSQACWEIAVVVGPLWIAGEQSDDREGLTPEQRRYVSGQRARALMKFENVFGRQVLHGTV
ncbi:hypothetical protein [Streptomyces californicus]|uniref:hypothetical protein n=1 Tax=Streptomyces californicus TaxID=67351 RepID=UPI00296E6CA2|nr:hypothetical protein [Streptomyces californicus]MDW4912488.1 hypothetical protein [Streptomyces californicus]